MHRGLVPTCSTSTLNGLGQNLVVPDNPIWHATSLALAHGVMVISGSCCVSVGATHPCKLSTGTAYSAGIDLHGYL